MILTWILFRTKVDTILWRVIISLTNYVLSSVWLFHWWLVKFCRWRLRRECYVVFYKKIPNSTSFEVEKVSWFKVFPLSALQISVINNPKPRFVTAISKLPPDVTDFLAQKVQQNAQNSKSLKPEKFQNESLCKLSRNVQDFLCSLLSKKAFSFFSFLGLFHVLT